MRMYKNYISFIENILKKVLKHENRKDFVLARFSMLTIAKVKNLYGAPNEIATSGNVCSMVVLFAARS